MRRNFEIDTAPLRESLVASVQSKFPEFNFNPERLEGTVATVLEDHSHIANQSELGEYQPNDKKWKHKLDPERVAELEPILQRIRARIATEDPTLEKILETPMSEIDKQRAVQLFDHYQTLDAYSDQWYASRRKLHILLRDSPRYNTLIDASRVDTVDTLLHTYREQLPTVQKILDTHIPQSEKIEALRMYETWQEAMSKIQTLVTSSCDASIT